ncbi:hypothetical protein DL96DRAFT_1602288 [Flagelloscypha sp. PMI_526]|nr:hypothetical protein DL96DRAFT_1602288 [Flagelloscypha sp. PMI_526]
MSHSRSPPSSPVKRHRPPNEQLGINPKALVGKTLRRSKRSSLHPSLILECSNSPQQSGSLLYQLRIPGYDPRHRGVPKELLINDSPTDELPNSPIVDCVLIQLSDKAFRRPGSPGSDIEWWNQDHTALALKFEEPHRGWHTVCARLQDHDPALGDCTFRSYTDVYIEELQRSPRKRQRTHL